MGFARVVGLDRDVVTASNLSRQVLYTRQDVWTFRHHWGGSCHKARVVSDHLETVQRLVWLEPKWPTMVRAA